MRTSMLLLAGLVAAPPTAAAQSPDFYARIGVTGSTRLAEDLIADNDITINQAMQPTILLGGAIDAFPRYRVDLELAFATGSYEATSDSRPDQDLGTLSNFWGTIGLQGPLAGEQLRWRASIGALMYLPSEDSGIFARGGPTDLLLGAGLDWRKPVASGIDIMIGGRYDFHRFTTGELEARGFSQHQARHRVSLTVGVATGGGS